MEQKDSKYNKYKFTVDELLMSSKGDLDQFVVRNNEINIDNEIADKVELFLQNAVEESWDNDSFVVDLFAYLRSEYIDSDNKLDRFLNFCEEYVQSKRKPYVYYGFLRDMKWEQFVEAVDFCLHNRILQITMKQLDGISYKEEMLIVNICYNIIQMRVMANYAKDKTEDEVKKMIGLGEKKTDYVYDAIDNYLDQLWKICITRAVIDNE